MTSLGVNTSFHLETSDTVGDQNLPFTVKLDGKKEKKQWTFTITLCSDAIDGKQYQIEKTIRSRQPFHISIGLLDSDYTRTNTEAIDLTSFITDSFRSSLLVKKCGEKILCTITPVENDVQLQLSSDKYTIEHFYTQTT